MRRRAWLVALFIVVAPIPAHAQLWSGIIDHSRAIDWSSAGIVGGIPSRTTICATLNPGATAAQINSAIAACPPGQVVFLNAGIYNLSAGVDFAGKSNVTLRGAGPDRTFLVFTGSATCWGNGGDICVRNSDLNWVQGPAHTANWTAGYAAGSTQITLDNTTNLAVGSILILDQLDDTSDTGGVYVCATQGVCGTDIPGGAGRPNREQQQFVRVTAISGSTITISPGLYMPNWRSSQSPGAWWASTIVTMDGIENMSVDHTGSGSGKSGIYLINAYQCWVKNVRSLNANRNHVWLYQTARSAVRDSYFYATQNAFSQSYGVESYMSSDNLIENNIFQHVTTPVQMNNSSGTVASYNFSTDDFYQVLTWQIGGQSYHEAGTAMNLHEGNDANGFLADTVHGTHNLITTFRNRFTGLEPGKTQQTSAVILNTHTRYFNFVGNVLGTQGYHNTYQSVPPSGTNANKSIYVLGWSGNEGTTGSLANDPLTTSTLLRWGNYDVVNGAVQWNPGEIPSGNAVPANHNLPASFYLAAKPAWWGTMPWPPIGPDVTGGQDVAGHAYKIPARLCYENTPRDANGILSFNAINCYTQGSASVPSPPVNPQVQ